METRSAKGIPFLVCSLFLFVIFPIMVSAEKGLSGQKIFPTAEEALAELKAAIKSGDSARLTEIFGEVSRDIFFTGDPVGDSIALKNLSIRFEERAELLPVISEDYYTEQWYRVRYGIEGWNMQVPLVDRGKGWSFATEYATDTNMKRRRVLNEVYTVDTLHALVKAQVKFQSKDRNGDGVLEYAQKFRSGEGKQDGLYWPAKEGEEQSPIDGMVVKALLDGYKPHPKGTPTYYGYVYKILTKQGGKTRGGKKSYLKDGRMVNGFAILAYPVEWKVSGDATFMVGPDSQVWKKDLGTRTESIAKDIDSMDIDQTWVRVNPMLGGKNSRSNW